MRSPPSSAHLPGAGNGRDTPEQVAVLIWRAIDRGANSVYAPGVERLFVLLQRCAPGLIDSVLSRPPSRVT